MIDFARTTALNTFHSFRPLNHPAIVSNFCHLPSVVRSSPPVLPVVLGIDVNELLRQIVTGELPMENLAALYLPPIVISYFLHSVIFLLESPHLLLILYASASLFLASLLIFLNFSFFAFLLVSVSLGAISVLFIFASMASPPLSTPHPPRSLRFGFLCYLSLLIPPLLLPVFHPIVHPSPFHPSELPNAISSPAVLGQVMGHSFPLLTAVLGLLLLAGSALPLILKYPRSSFHLNSFHRYFAPSSFCCYPELDCSSYGHALRFPDLEAFPNPPFSLNSFFDLLSSLPISFLLFFGPFLVLVCFFLFFGDDFSGQDALRESDEESQEDRGKEGGSGDDPNPPPPPPPESRRERLRRILRKRRGVAAERDPRTRAFKKKNFTAAERRRIIHSHRAARLARRAARKIPKDPRLREIYIWFYSQPPWLQILIILAVAFAAHGALALVSIYFPEIDLDDLIDFVVDHIINGPNPF